MSTHEKLPDLALYCFGYRAAKLNSNPVLSSDVIGVALSHLVGNSLHVFARPSASPLHRHVRWNLD